MAVTRPKQRVPLSQKGKKWERETMEYYSSMCNTTIDPSHAAFLYRVASGILEGSDYLYVANPLSTKKEEWKSYPGRIRNMDITSPIVLLHMGEKKRRHINSMVVAKNSDIESIKKEHENELVLQNLKTTWRNELQMMGIDVGQEVDPETGQPTEIPYTEDFIRQKVDSVQDILSIQGQDSLEYIMWYNDVSRIFRIGFFDFIVTNHVCSYKDVWRDEVEYEIIPPYEISYMNTSNLEFLEDAPAIKRRSRWNITEVIDKFQDVDGFTDKIALALEERLAGNVRMQRDYNPVTGLGMASRARLWKNVNPVEEKGSSEDISVEHLIWTSFARVGTLSIQNLLGEIEEIEVDEDFIAREWEEVDWEWVPEKWEGYFIDDEYYVGVRPLVITRAPKGHPDKCKNPYNGRGFNTKIAEGKSIVEKGYAYQMRHNIVHYYIERALGRNLDKLAVLPKNLIDPEKGEIGTMYYAQAQGILWVDPAESNKSLEYLSAIKVLDLQLGTYISELTRFLEYNKREWEESVGITRQRKGQANSSDGKAVTEEALYRGTTMTEEFFSQYDEFQRREMQGMLDLSIYAFSEGKKAQYVRSDGMRAFLNVNPESFVHGDYLVMVSDSGKDVENMQIMRSQAMAFAQNQMVPSLVGKLLNHTNMESLIADLEAEEAKIQEQGAQQAQQEQAANEAKNAVELDKIRLSNEGKAEVARIQQGNESQGAEDGGLTVAPTTPEDTSLQQAAMKDNTDRYKIAMDEKQNIRDNETALKNKVVGEK